MAIKKRSLSVLKNIRQNKKRREMNKAIKSEAKGCIKMAIKSIEKAEKEESLEKTKCAFKKIDRAAKKGIFHKNKANRLKSKLSKRFSSV